PFYDSLIAQIICYGDDRNDTIQKLYEYLDSVSIKGICTNIPMLKRILKDEVFVGGIYDTTYLPEFLARTDQQSLIDEIEASASDNTSVVDVGSFKIEGTDELKVVSVSTGIFYGRPSPSEPEFVTVGSVISVNDTICLMEAMKIFSTVTLKTFNRQGVEIFPADQKYRVERINNATGQQVATGDLLFVVSPVSD
ncbi:MAG: carbamoyl-phosphate synthase large subunit, partial [Gammaproteobacteria bacterium]|nr:carbamoyl-phosphate synthase large subunit [Gammaproteobacteria bacterium]